MRVKAFILKFICLMASSFALAQPVIAECDHPSTLDLTQTVFLFDFFSNSTSDTRGTERQLADFEYSVIVDGNLENPLNNLVAPGMIKTIGCQMVGQDWQLVWGPSVYELPGSLFKADNTALMVYSSSLDTYILAIAGTDPTAALDWINEDFEVGPTELVNWPYDASSPPVKVNTDPARPQISLGTAHGLYYVLNLGTQATQAPARHLNLGQYLSQLSSTSSNTKLIVTGHSLGGALAPTIAYWAKNTMTSNGRWYGQIYAMPTAGPSPGNNLFALEWDEKFPSFLVDGVNANNQVRSLNTPIFNQWDLVPHAWSLIYEQNAQASNGFYFWGWNFDVSHPPVPPVYNANSQMGTLAWPVSLQSRAFLTAVDVFNLKGKLAGMAQSNHRQEILGSWPINVLKNNVVCPFYGPGPSPITSVYKFLESLGLLHIWSYYSAFGITSDTLLRVKPIDLSHPQSCNDSTPIPTIGEWARTVMMLMMIAIVGLYGWKMKQR